MMSFSQCIFPEKQMNIKPPIFLLEFGVGPARITSLAQSTGIKQYRVTHMKEYNCDPVSFSAVHLLYDTL